MDKTNGSRWFGSAAREILPYDTTYSAPSLVTIDGQRQLILGAGDGAIWGFQPTNRKTALALRSVACAASLPHRWSSAIESLPATVKKTSATYNNVMGAVVGLKISGTGDDTKVEELWKQIEVVAGYSEPVLIDNRLYVVDDRCKMWIFDADTGEAIVERKSFVGSRQRSALLHADGKIYVLTENGRWAIVATDRRWIRGAQQGSRSRHRIRGFADRCRRSTVLPQHDGVVLRGHRRQHSNSRVDMADSMGEETPVTKNPTVAQVQIVPAEALLKPGETAGTDQRTSSMRWVNDWMIPAQVTFEVDGAGTVEGSTFTASADAAHTGSDDHRTSRRRRPERHVFASFRHLPWKFTFDDLRDPPLVLGRCPLPTRDSRDRRIAGADQDHHDPQGSAKPCLDGARATCPSTRSVRTFAGPRMSDQLPDIGLTAHGYVLDLMGESQQLQIRTWSAQLRMASDGRAFLGKKTPGTG